EDVAGEVVDALGVVARGGGADGARAGERGLGRPADLALGLVVSPGEGGRRGAAARRPLPLLVRGQALVLRGAEGVRLREVDADDRVVALAGHLVRGLRGALEVVAGALAGLHAGGVRVGGGLRQVRAQRGDGRLVLGVAGGVRAAGDQGHARLARARRRRGRGRRCGGGGGGDGRGRRGR